MLRKSAARRTLSQEKWFLVFICATLLIGCASVTRNSKQLLDVRTTLDNVEVLGSSCTLANDQGKWFITTPGEVMVEKSTADLNVECFKDGVGLGRQIISSKTNSSAVGNILAGGGIGYLVDRGTGAGFDYQPSITVLLKGLSKN